eukprot:219684_1
MQSNDKKTSYVPSLIIHGGDEDWNVLRPTKLTALLINGCIRKWMNDPNILSNLNQTYNDDITTIIISKYEWLYSLYYSLEQLHSLKRGDEVDFRMDNGKYVLANIVAINGTNYKLKSAKHNAVNDELCYATEWDIDYESAFKTQQKRFAKPKVISARTRFESYRFHNPDVLGRNQIWVKPPGVSWWVSGSVIRFDEATYRDHSTETYSKQILVRFTYKQQNYEFWTHLDDHEEIAQWILEPKEWKIAFNTKPPQIAFNTIPPKEWKSYGPFTAGQIKFIYEQNRYELFRSGLYQNKGEMKIKNIKDDKWTAVDEVGIYLLMATDSHLRIKTNGTAKYLQQIINEKTGHWIYRTGKYGAPLSILYTRADLSRREKWGNYGVYNIKRVGEQGWYESNDIDLKILFYHLRLHPDIKIPLGINNIKQRMEKAHTQRLTPYFPYDEWVFIELSMKSMQYEHYYTELRKYFNNSNGLQNINDIVNDLESFIIADDYKYGNDSEIANHFNKIITDNTKCIKILFTIYDACKLLPVFKVWTDTFHIDYLEKWFSYTRCADHQSECCPIIQRLVGLDLFIHIFNKEITHIPGNINKASPYWITLNAVLSVLPHYSMDRLNKDWTHLYECITSTETLRIGDSDDDDDGEIAKVDAAKIFWFFDQHPANCQIKCFVEDCHTMNRKCFPARTHIPYPFPFEWDSQDERARTEYKIVNKLDSLHNMMHHIPLYIALTAKMKLELMDEMEQKTLKLFIQRRRAANEKYKGIIDHPKRYYWEDNIVGWVGIQDTVVSSKSQLKDNAKFVKQKIKKIQKETACESFEELDVCLGRYYEKCGRNDYFNEDKEGIFSIWAEENGFEFEDIIEELNADADDCASVDFDCDDNGVNNFPGLESVSNETERANKIIDVINRCIKNTIAYKYEKENDYDELYFALQLLHK